MEGLKIAAMAETYHVHVLPHNPNGQLSTLVGIHFGACAPNFQMLETIGPDSRHQRPDLDGVFEGMPAVDDGAMIVPTRPGWGQELTEGLLDR